MQVTQYSQVHDKTNLPQSHYSPYVEMQVTQYSHVRKQVSPIPIYVAWETANIVRNRKIKYLSQIEAGISYMTSLGVPLC